MKAIFTYIKNEIVLTVSFILAVISSCIVKPDEAYLSYIDYRTLAILFCLMGVMAGFRRLGLLRQAGQIMISHVTTIRGVAIILVLMCFFFSMFITNDVALLTFVPFAIVSLHMAGMDQYLIPVITLETVAANLGSMMMPMGNPQNLYLFSLTDMSLGQFLLLMLPYGAVSLLLILLLCFLLIKPAKASLLQCDDYSRTAKEKCRIVMYLLLFLLSLLVVARVLDYRLALVAELILLLLFDRPSLKQVDYTLILTFIFLFIFIGNMKRIDVINAWLTQTVAGHEFPVSIIASQVISNVPAAILLSGFTSNVKALILGTNLGGLGTLIASMASLISFKQYSNVEGANKSKYIALFTAVNVGLLGLLVLLYLGLR